MLDMVVCEFCVILATQQQYGSQQQENPWNLTDQLVWGTQKLIRDPESNKVKGQD